MEQESATTEKQHLEKRLQDESLGLHTSYSDLEVSQLKAEIEVGAVSLCFISLFYNVISRSEFHDIRYPKHYTPMHLADVKVGITTGRG